MTASSFAAAVVLVSVGLVAACSTGDPGAPGPKGGDDGTGPNGAITFHEDVEPILQKRCQKCHQPGGLAPFSLLTYADAKPMAPMMTAETAARRMPPWGAHDTEECKPRLGWNHDERLTDAEIKTIADWDAAGAPEGDPKDAPPPASTKPLTLANPTHTLAPKSAWTSNGKDDQFRCFVLDAPTLEAGAYVNGVHVVPGNRKVVHHAVVFTDPDGAFSKSRVGADGSFECSSAATMQGGAMTVSSDPTKIPIILDVWTPGVEPVELPSSIAIPVTPGSKIVLQIHYSPGGRDDNEPDTTKVELRTTLQRPDYLLFTSGVGNYPAPINGEGLLPGPNDQGAPEFRIPAREAKHVESMIGTIPARLPGQENMDVWIYGVMAHAHLAGVDVKIDLEKKGDTQCLLQDRWDFHWQRMYTYASPIETLPTLDPGDKIRLRCTYDNTMGNRRLAAEYRARELQPMDIHLGEETLDEMCLAITQLLVKNPGDETCKMHATAAACNTCCYANHATGTDHLVKELAKCECGANGPCQAACATTLCASPVVAADAACQACTAGNITTTCSSVLTSCYGVPDCAALLGCLTNSGCASKLP